MALFRRKKQQEGGSERPGAAATPQPEPGLGYEAAQSEPQPAPLGSGLERKWEEAWRKARSGRASS